MNIEVIQIWIDWFRFKKFSKFTFGTKCTHICDLMKFNPVCKSVATFWNSIEIYFSGLRPLKYISIEFQMVTIDGHTWVNFMRSQMWVYFVLKVKLWKVLKWNQINSNLSDFNIHKIEYFFLKRELKFFYFSWNEISEKSKLRVENEICTEGEARKL